MNKQMLKLIIKYKIVITVALFSIVFISCNNNIEFEEFADFNNAEWETQDTISFNLPINDTAKTYDLNILMRHNGEYPYSNIYFFTNIEAPNGIMVTDTLEFILADKKGQWQGKGWGNIWSYNLKYRENIIFPFKGIYKFSLVQGMRNENLPGIINIGVSLGKSVEQK